VRPRSRPRDRDSKFSAAFERVFRSEGIKVIHTPIRAARADADADRFVRTIRSKCLEWLLILGHHHLERAGRVHPSLLKRSEGLIAAASRRPLVDPSPGARAIRAGRSGKKYPEIERAE